MHQVMTRPAPSMACLPAPRTPSTRARSRATDGFSAMTSCTAAPAYRFSEAAREVTGCAKPRSSRSRVSRRTSS